MKILSKTKIDMSDLESFSDNALLTAKRQLREPILKAFDVYKSNVYYGIVTETETQHAEIVEWYDKLCNLDETALKEIPSPIKRYL